VVEPYGFEMWVAWVTRRRFFLGRARPGFVPLGDTAKFHNLFLHEGCATESAVREVGCRRPSGPSLALGVILAQTERRLAKAILTLYSVCISRQTFLL